MVLTKFSGFIFFISLVMCFSAMSEEKAPLYQINFSPMASDRTPTISNRRPYAILRFPGENTTSYQVLFRCSTGMAARGALDYRLPGQNSSWHRIRRFPSGQSCVTFLRVLRTQRIEGASIAIHVFNREHRLVIGELSSTQGLESINSQNNGSEN